MSMSFTSSRFATKDAPSTETEASGNPQAAANRMKAASSFGQSALNGKGGFGSCSGRDLPWAQNRGATPRGAESPGRTSTPGRRRASTNGLAVQTARQQSPSAAFAAKGDRFAPHRDATPGPGSYTDRPQAKVKRSSSFGSSTSKRFEQQRSQGPDPGQYGPLGSAFAPPSRGPSAIFGSKSTRELFGKAGEAGPDPGQYDQKDTLGWQAQKQRSTAAPSAAFANRSGRFEKPTTRGPDPGVYHNSGAPTDIGNVRARGTFGKSAIRGAGGFGSTSGRGEGRVVDKKMEDAPGPGAYEPQPLGPHNGQERGNSVFASKSSRMHVRNTDAPGVGAYNAHAATDLAESAVKSHNKQVGSGAASFGSKAPMLWERRGKETGDGPGPGSYGQEHRTLESTHAGGRGVQSAAFASNSLREPSFLGGAY